MLSRVFNMFDRLTSLIEQANNLDVDTRVDAIDKINILAQRDEIPSEKFNEVFNLFVLGAGDEVSAIKLSSLSGIKYFIEKNKLCVGKTWQALDLSIEKITDLDNEVRNNALLVIIELIKQDKLFAERVDTILDILIINAQDINDNIAKSAIFGINKLIVNNKLSANKLEAVWNLFITTANSEHAIIKKETLFGIGELIKKGMILADKTESTLNLLIENSKSVFSDIKKDALFSIGELIEKSELPIGKTDAILSLFMIEAKSTYFIVRKEALFGISCLIIKDLLPANRIETVFELLVAGTRYLDDGSRRESLFGISKLIEKNKLPINKVELVLDVFIKEISNINITSRKNAITGINKIIVRNQLPLNKVDEIWGLFIAICHDDHIAVKKAIMFGIAELIIKYTTPLEKIEELFNLLVMNAINSHSGTDKNEIIFSIGELIQRVQLPEKSTEQALTFFLTQAKDNHNQIDGKIIFFIIKLIEKHNVPEEKIRELSDLLILGAKNVDIEIQNNSLYGLAKLIKDNRLGAEKIEEVWALFLTGLRSTNADLKEIALFGIGKLIENNNVSVEKLKKVINIFSLDKKYGALREFFFLKIVILIKNNALSAERIEQIIELFIENSEDVSINIRKEILKGIVELIDKNELHESKLYILLNLLENRIKLESCQHTKHVAIVAIKKLADQNLIPEYKIEIILNLLISLQRSNTLLFNGISEIEKEEIAEVLNGITIAKINAAHPSIAYLISGTENLTNEAKADAVLKLTLLIKKEKVSAEKIAEVLAFLTVKAKDPYDNIRNNALSGINELIDKDILPIDAVEEMLSLFITGAKNANNDTRKYALLGVNKLIEKSQLPVKKVEKIIDVLIARAKDTDVEIKKHALFGINKLIEKNKLIAKKIEKILDILIEESKNIDVDLSLNALRLIIKLEEQDKITSERIEDVLEILIFKATSVNADIKLVLIPCIVRLIEKSNLSEERIEEILELLMTNTDNAKATIRKSSLSGIIKLIVNYKLSIEKNQKILDLLIVRTKDTKIDIRQKAIFGISKLIEKNNLPLEGSKETLCLLIIMTKDNDSEIRSSALYGIRWLIEKNDLPENKIEELLSLLVSGINDEDRNVRNIVLSWLSQFITDSDLLAEKIGKELDFLIERELLEDSTLYIKQLKELIDSAVKPRIEDSQDKITEILSFSSHAKAEFTLESAEQILEQQRKIDQPSFDAAGFTEELLVEEDNDAKWNIVSGKDSRSHNSSKKKKVASILPKDTHKTIATPNKKPLSKSSNVIKIGLAAKKALPSLSEDISIERSTVDKTELMDSKSVDEHTREAIALPQAMKIKKDDISDFEPFDSLEIASSKQLHDSLEAVSDAATPLAGKEIEIKFGSFDDTSIIASAEETLMMSKPVDEHTREAIELPQAVKIKKDDVPDLKSSGVREVSSSNQMRTSLEAVVDPIVPLAEEKTETKFGSFDGRSIITPSELQVHREIPNPSTTLARKKHYYKPYNKSPYVPKNALIQEIQQLYANQQAMAGEIQRLNYVLQNTAQQTYYHQFLNGYNSAYQSAMQQTFYQHPYVSNAVPQNIVQEVIQLQDYRGKIYYCIREQHLDTGQLNQFFIDPATGGQVFPISYSLYRKEDIGELSENSGSVIQGTIEIDETIDRVNERFDDISIQSEYRSESFTVSQTLQFSASSDSVMLSAIDSSMLKSEFWKLSVLCNKNKAFVFLESKNEYRAVISTIHHDLSEYKSIASSDVPKDLAAEFIEEHYFSNVDVGLVQGTKRLSSGTISYEEKSNDGENALLISDGKSYQRTKIMFQSLGEALHSKLHLDQSFNAYASDNEEVFHYILLDLSYEEADRLQQEWDTKLSERLVEDGKSEIPTVNQISPPIISSNLVDLSQEIASSVLVKVKILLKTEGLMVESNESEVEFVSELAKKLVITNCILLELLEKNLALKLLFIEQLAAELNHNSQLYIENEKFCIQEELKQNIGGFISSIVAQAKASLKQHEYRDSSNNIIEIRYVNNIHYDSDNLILRREELLYEAGQIGGIKAIDDLIELGEDPEIATTLIEAARQYGIKHVLNIMFSNQHTENAKLLKIETSADMCLLPYEQNSAVLRLQIDLLATNNNLNKDEIYQTPIASTLKYFITQFLERLNLDISWQYKKFIYHHDLKQLREILQNNNIDRSIDVLMDYSDFRKSVLFKLHPDKGGNNDEFVFVKELQEKFSADLDVNKLIADKVQVIQDIVYKASIGFKIMDTIVDTARLVYEPTIYNTKKVIIDSTYIYSMYSGVNGHSLSFSAIEAIYQIYQGEYSQALQHVATSASYMALPVMIGYAGIPYLGFVYGVGITLYSGYSAISNVYSFYQEYTSVVYSIRSFTAYKDAAQFLSQSSLQNIYDFAIAAKKYAVELNNILLVQEKADAKQQLEVKGEFGEKLYTYIHVPLLEEKYALLNKVIQNELTEEQAEALKAKHIKITLGNQNYDHCMEIKATKENEDNNNDRYYCYNEEHKTLDRIVIGESSGYVEVIERL